MLRILLLDAEQAICNEANIGQVLQLIYLLPHLFDLHSLYLLTAFKSVNICPQSKGASKNKRMQYDAIKFFSGHFEPFSNLNLFKGFGL